MLSIYHIDENDINQSYNWDIHLKKIRYCFVKKLQKSSAITNISEIAILCNAYFFRPLTIEKTVPKIQIPEQEINISKQNI